MVTTGSSGRRWPALMNHIFVSIMRTVRCVCARHLPGCTTGTRQASGGWCDALNNAIVQEWFEGHDKELKVLTQQPNSSDLSPIKDLWDVLDKRSMSNLWRPHSTAYRNEGICC